MNKIFSKCILYAYPNLDAIVEQIDKLVDKKAVNSICDNSPAFSQYVSIINLTNQKDVLFFIKDEVKKVVEGLSYYDTLCVRYKYFKNLANYNLSEFDPSLRSYFRRQVKLIGIISDKFEKAGLTDKFFTENVLNNSFFKELLKRVIEYEETSVINKQKKRTPKKDKIKNERKIIA